MSDPTPDSIPEDQDRPLTQGEKHAQAMQMAAPIDKSLIGRPIGGPPRYQHKLRTGDQLTRPSVTLDPGNIEKLDGFSEHGHLVQEAADAMRLFHGTVEDLITARERSKKDPERPAEASQILRVAEYVDKVWEPVSRKGDAARVALEQRIARAEGQLRADISPDTSHLSAQAAEIRAHARGLSTEQRIKWLNGLIADNDTESLAAVLRGKAYLSGLTRESSDAFVMAYNQARKPQVVAQLDFMRRALTKLDAAHRMFVHEQIEGAMGCSRAMVSRLRKERAAAAFG